MSQGLVGSGRIVYWQGGKRTKRNKLRRTPRYCFYDGEVLVTKTSLQLVIGVTIFLVGRRVGADRQRNPAYTFLHILFLFASPEYAFIPLC